MNIEFQIVQGGVQKGFLNAVRDKLLTLHRKDKEIAKAQVIFREKPEEEDSKICEVELLIYGGSLYVHRRADSYERAFGEVLEVLADTIEDQLRKQNEPPDEITTTVEI